MGSLVATLTPKTRRGSSLLCTREGWWVVFEISLEEPRAEHRRVALSSASDLSRGRGERELRWPSADALVAKAPISLYDLACLISRDTAEHLCNRSFGY